MKTMTCNGCTWWSELVAQASGSGPVKAMCLNSDLLQYQRMTSGGCGKYHAGVAIDDPHRSGKATREVAEKAREK